MIVCHCEVVSDRDVAEAVHNGARSLSDVCRSTGAGKNCGTCIFSVKQLVCQHVQVPGPVPAPQLAEAERAAS